MLPQSTVALRVSRSYSKVVYDLKRSKSRIVHLLKEVTACVAFLVCVLQKLSASAFIEPSLHQLDSFRNLFMETCITTVI